VPFCTLGFLNSPFQRNQPTNPPEVRQLEPDDDNPLTWNPWNNRPFVSGNELMLVPRVRASQLLRQYTTNEEVDEDNLYQTPVLDKPLPAVIQQRPAQRPNEDLTPFTQLENFFYDRERGAAAGQQVVPQPSHLYRLLDYVGTQSLYVGAGEWLNPGWYGNAAGTTPAPTMPGDPLHNRRPPFNWISNFREPGRVNLNTIYSQDVYRGLFHAEGNDDVEPDANDMHPGPRWDDDDDSLVRSRRGYGGGGDDMLSFDPTLPTFFANPFRSGDAAMLVPLANMMRTGGGGNGGPEVHGVECTLLRSTSASAGVVDDDPLFAADTDDDYNDADRTPFFRYAPMTRLDNLVTTHSNVYAVWITIGFFEVEELRDGYPSLQNFGGANTATAAAANDPAFARVYPDLYAFGKEDGLDEGNVRRLRGFYIIDRSRPAGFAPGVDNNVENTIRLRRRIE
jgi:hypothetical protein